VKVFLGSPPKRREVRTNNIGHTCGHSFESHELGTQVLDAREEMRAAAEEYALSYVNLSCAEVAVMVMKDSEIKYKGNQLQLYCTI
jgi:hypothetical protein